MAKNSTLCTKELEAEVKNQDVQGRSYSSADKSRSKKTSEIKVSGLIAPTKQKSKVPMIHRENNRKRREQKILRDPGWRAKER